MPAGDRTKLHVIGDEAGSDTPICRQLPFAFGAECGTGLEAAKATGRGWRGKCWAHLIEKIGIDCEAWD